MMSNSGLPSFTLRTTRQRTAAVLRLPPLVWLLEIGYWLVARTRSWYGRFLPPVPKIEREG